MDSSGSIWSNQSLGDSSTPKHLPHRHEWIPLLAYAVLLVIGFLGLAVHARWSIQSRQTQYGPWLSARIHLNSDDEGEAKERSSSPQQTQDVDVDVGLSGGRCKRKCLSWFRYLPLRQRCLICGNAPLGFHVALMAFAVTRFTSQLLIYLGISKRDPRIGYLEVLSLSFNLMWLSLLVVYWTTIQLQRKNTWYLLSWLTFWTLNAFIMIGLLVLCHYTMGHREEGLNQFLAARESENLGEICVAVFATIFFIVTWGLWKKASEEAKNDVKAILVINFFTCSVFLSRALVIIMNTPLRQKWYFVSVLYWVPDISTALCYTILMWQRYLLHEEILAEGIGRDFESMMAAWLKSNTFQRGRGTTASLSDITDDNVDRDTMNAPLLSGQAQGTTQTAKLEQLVQPYWNALQRRKNDLSLRVQFSSQMLTAVTTSSCFCYKHRLPILQRLCNKLDEVVQSSTRESSTEDGPTGDSVNVEMSRCHQVGYTETCDDSFKSRLVKTPQFPASSCCFLGLRAGSLNVSDVVKSITKPTEGNQASESIGPSLRVRNKGAAATEPDHDTEFGSQFIAFFSRSIALTKEEKNRIKSQFESEWCCKELPCRGYFLVLNPSFLAWAVKTQEKCAESLSPPPLMAVENDERDAKHILQVASFCKLRNLVKPEYQEYLRPGRLQLAAPSNAYSSMLTNVGWDVLNNDPPPRLFVIAGETERLRDKPYIEVEETPSLDAKNIRYKVTAAFDVSFHKCVPIPTLPVLQLRELATLAGVNSDVPVGYWCISFYDRRRSMQPYPTPPEQPPTRSVSAATEQKPPNILSRLRAASSGAASSHSTKTLEAKPPSLGSDSNKLRGFSGLFNWIASVPTFSIDFEDGLNSLLRSIFHRCNAEYEASFCHGCFSIPTSDDVLRIQACTGKCDVTNGYFTGLRKEPRKRSYSFGDIVFGRYMVTAFTSPVSLHLGPRTMAMGYNFEIGRMNDSDGLYNLIEYVTESNAAATVPRSILPWMLARRMESGLNLANAATEFVSRTLPESERYMSRRTHELSVFGRVISYLQFYEEIFQDIKSVNDLQGVVMDRAYGIYRYWSNSFLQTRQRGQSQPAFDWQDLHRLRREETAVEEAVNTYTTLTFKPSIAKAKFNFRYMPTNLHVHRLFAFRAEMGLQPSAFSSSIVTVGAPSIQYCDLQGHSLLRRIRSYKHSEKSLRKHQDYHLPRLRTRKRRQLEMEQLKTLFHADSVVSQAVSGAISAVVASLDIVLDSLTKSARGGTDDQSARQKIPQWFDCGFPIFWESLLSSFRDERDMLEDMDVGVQSLAFFGFELLLSETVEPETEHQSQGISRKISVSWEGIEFQRCKLREDYPLGVFRIPIKDPFGILRDDDVLQEYMQKDKYADSPNRVASLIPVLFGYGLNEWQPLGEIVNPELYHGINARSLEIVRYYSNLVRCRWHDQERYWDMRNKLYTLLRSHSADALEVLDWLVDADVPTIKTPIRPFTEPPSTYEPNIDRVFRLVNRVEEITKEHRERVKHNRSKVDLEQAAKLSNTEDSADAFLLKSHNRFAELLLEIFESIGNLLDAGRLTSCKSAKDRTGMAVTLEHVRNALDALFGDKLPENTEKQAQVDTANHLREYGSRIHLVCKNTRVNSETETSEGSTQFAINAVQNRWFPPSYQCPPSVLHSSGKAIT